MNSLFRSNRKEIDSFLNAIELDRNCESDLGALAGFNIRSGGGVSKPA